MVRLNHLRRLLATPLSRAKKIALSGEGNKNSCQTLSEDYDFAKPIIRIMKLANIKSKLIQMI
jgi:hypothetical protein